MKKLISVISLILCLALVFGACANTADNETTTTAEETTAAAEKAAINLGMLKGPTGMGAASLLGKDALGTANADYELTLAASPDVFTSALLSGEIDIAAIPVNVAATLYAKSQGKVQILAVNTLGVLYLMDNTGEIKSVSDLKGKTILSAGQGTTTEYVLNYILAENGIDAEKDVTIEYAAEHAEVLTQAVAGKYSVVLLPEPFVTQLKSKDAGFNTCIDLTAEWEKLGGGSLTMGCVAVRTEFAENNPEAVSAFLKDYEESISFVNENTEDAAALIEKYEIAAAAIAKTALPNCNITFLAGEEMKTNVSAYLEILHGFSEASVGGSVPGDEFYYIGE